MIGVTYTFDIIVDIGLHCIHIYIYKYKIHVCLHFMIWYIELYLSLFVPTQLILMYQYN